MLNIKKLKKNISYLLMIYCNIFNIVNVICKKSMTPIVIGILFQMPISIEAFYKGFELCNIYIVY